MKSESNWHISRAYYPTVNGEKVYVKEHWNRDTQSWQKEKGGEGYTQRGGDMMHTKLFAQSCGLPYLSVKVKKESI